MKHPMLAAVLAAPLLWSSSLASAAVAYELKIAGVTGGSVRDGFAGWSDIGTFAWDVSSVVSTGGGGGSGGSGGGTGKATFSDFSWTQLLDKSIPTLFVAVASGVRYGTATLDVINTASPGVTFFQMVFTNPVMDKVSVEGSGSVPTIAASLGGYTSVAMTYRPQNADGSFAAPITGTWNLLKNTPDSDPTLTFSGDPEVLNGLFESGGTLAAVPEPQSWALMGAGIGALLWFSRQRRPAQVGRG